MIFIAPNLKSTLLFKFFYFSVIGKFTFPLLPELFLQSLSGRIIAELQPQNLLNYVNSMSLQKKF